MKIWVCVIEEVLYPISVKTNVKQEELLAPILFAMLFALVLHGVFAESDLGIYIRYKTSANLFNICRFLTASKI